MHFAQGRIECRLRTACNFAGEAGLCRLAKLIFFGEQALADCYRLKKRQYELFRPVVGGIWPALPAGYLQMNSVGNTV